MNYHTVRIDDNQKQLLERLKQLFATGYGSVTIFVKDGKVIRHEVTLSTLVTADQQEQPFQGLEIVKLD